MLRRTKLLVAALAATLATGIGVATVAPAGGAQMVTATNNNWCC